MSEKIKGLQFTTRFRLQGKIRKFIKELDYNVEGVSGFNLLDQNRKDALLEWKKRMLIGVKNKLAACYEEIVGDMSCEDTAIFKLHLRTEELKGTENEN